MLVGAFNQEKALVGAFSVIVSPIVEPMDRFTALVETEGEGERSYFKPYVCILWRSFWILHEIG